jgi:hypothetical protein
MKRIMMLVGVVALMAAMLLTSALPVLADPPPNKPGQYTCVTRAGFGQPLITHRNVPLGQTAQYVATLDPVTGASGTCTRNS